MIGTRWQQKPPVGYGIDPAHPLAQGLVSFFALNEGTGLPFDLAGRVQAASCNATWQGSSSGAALALNGTSQYIGLGSRPDLATTTGNLSIVAAGMLVNNGANDQIFHCSDGSAYASTMYYNGTGIGELNFYAAAPGGSYTANGPAGTVDGNPHVFGLSVAGAATGGVRFYRDGAFVSSVTASVAANLNPATTTAWIGQTGGNIHWLKGSLSWLGVWNRTLSAAEQADLAANPWRVFRPRRPSTVAYLSGSEFAASPATIPANRPAGVSVSLAKLGTPLGWSGGTAFSLSGPAGTSLLGQSVADSNDATVTIATGSATGTIQISDGQGHGAHVAVANAAITPTPTSIPSSHGGQITITLSGYLTAWTPGSTNTFGIAGVAGVTLVSQSVASATAATIVLATGGGTGTLTISDGLVATTVTVAAPALVCSRSTLAATGTFGLVLTGNNTLWMQETASPLFTVAGYPGATLSNIVVTSNTTATATLSLGTGQGGGTATVADASTGTIAALPVLAVPSGSLHVTGPVLLGHTGGTPGLFGGQNAAAVSFFFQADSNAGLNLAAGTTVVGWGTSGTNGVPLAVYYPASQTLVFTAYGTAGAAHGQTFTASVPVQLGVGYHFLLDWSVTTPATFSGTLASGSPYVTGITSTAALRVGDLIAGTGIPTGTTILAIPGATAIQMSGNATSSGSPTISVTRGTQTLYLDGLPHTTGVVPYPTYAYQQIQVGGNAGLTGSGATVATDHQVSDLAVWSGSVPSSADAVGLASRSITPLSATARASAWFSLGGGTVGGATAALADLWFVDRTLNGNTLTVVAGSLGSSPAAYAAPIAVTSPAVVGAQVAKCGKLAIFSAMGAGLVNGANPITSVVAVNANPTVYRNGTAIQLGPPTWFGVNPNNPYDAPLVTYLLECGSLEAVAIGSGGSGYTNPTASATGGGGTGLVLGTPVVKTGITGYTVVNGGSGFASSPAVAILDSGGPGAGAAAYAVVNSNGTYVAQVNVTNGGSGYISPAVYIAAGYGESLTPSISGGALNGVTVGGGGSNYPGGTFPVAISDPTGSGAIYTATCSGGAITGFTKIAAGTGYSANPTIVVYNPAFSYAQPTATATATGGAVTGTTITNGGTGYGAPPAISASSPAGTAGPTGNITATPYPAVRGGAIAAVFPKVGGLLGCGSGYSAGSSVTISVGGSGAILTATVSGGVITAVAVTAGGSGFSSTGTTVTVVDSTGSGAVLAVTMSGTSIHTVAVSNGGANYSGSPSFTVGTGGVSIRPTVSGYIALVPVTAGGSGYNSAPTVTISDPTGSGAVLQPIMTGVQASDALTYSAPALWFTPQLGGLSLGGIQAVSGAAMDNWTGQREGTTGGLAAFSATPALLAGANSGSAPVGTQNDIAYYKNRRYNASGWGYIAYTASNIITFQADGRTPASWPAQGNVNGVSLLVGSSQSGNNYMDGMGRSGHPGQWTLQYDDPYFNTPAASAVWLGSSFSSGSGSHGVTMAMVPPPGSPKPVVISPADIHISGNTITSITTANTTFGTGWTAAMVIFGDGSPGYVGAAVAVVQNGTISQIVLTSGGSYSTAPTITVYPVAVSGTQVTAIYNVGYTGSPTAWNLGLFVCLSQGNTTSGGQYKIGNLWLVAPDTLNGNLAVASIDRTKPYAVDDVLIGSLTAPNGRTPGALRFMDAIAGYGGESNFIDANDLVISGSQYWGWQNFHYASFAFARCLNTDPSNTGYTLIDGVTPYSSTKIYGTQSVFAGGVNATFTTYGGAPVSGVPYLSLPASDMGNFMNPGTGNTLTFELRSIAPHGIKTGQTCQFLLTYYLTVTDLAGGSGYTSPPTITITGGSGTYASATATISGGSVTGVTIVGSSGYASTDTPTISFSGGGGSGASALLKPVSAFQLPTSGGLVFGSSNVGGWSGQVIVTGPYTVAVNVYVGGSGSAPQVVYSNVEIPISIRGQLLVPAVGACVPYEYAASMAAQAQTGLWCNLPPMGSDGLYQAIAQKVAANIGTTSTVYLEYGNENWNGGFTTALWQGKMKALLGLVPQGTQALTYFTGTGTKIVTYPQSLEAANAFKIFGDAWAAAGQPASRLKRIYGSWWSQGANFTGGILQVAQQFGAPAVDYTCVAPYEYLNSAPAAANACSPAGSWGWASGGSGSWPIDAINDLNRFCMAYSKTNWNIWQGHGRACQAYGQPLTPLTLNIYNAAATATLSPTTLASISASGGSYTSVPTVTLIGGGGTYTKRSRHAGVDVRGRRDLHLGRNGIHLGPDRHVYRRRRHRRERHRDRERRPRHGHHDDGERLGLHLAAHRQLLGRRLRRGRDRLPHGDRNRRHHRHRVGRLHVGPGGVAGRRRQHEHQHRCDGRREPDADLGRVGPGHGRRRRLRPGALADAQLLGRRRLGRIGGRAGRRDLGRRHHGDRPDERQRRVRVHVGPHDHHHGRRARVAGDRHLLRRLHVR